MKNYNKKGFTLVELLVVITILAIISVVAYQSFGGATDKAISGRKINDVSTIETALQQYKVEKKFYPPVGEYDGATNMWGYSTGTKASPSNTLTVKYIGNEIEDVLSGSGGGRIYGSGSLGQIGAKGTISRDVLGRQYLSADLYDPELGDTKVNSGSIKMIDKGFGRYVYSTYRKSPNWSNRNLEGVNYNIAYTIKKEGSDTYITKIVGDYDETACYDDSALCPQTLVGSLSGSTVLTDGQEQISTQSSNSSNQGIPYAVKDLYGTE